MFAFNRFRAFGRLGPRGKVVGQVSGLRRFFVLALSLVTVASSWFVIGLSTQASANPTAQVTTVLSGVAQPDVEAFDASNDLFVYNENDATITVLPAVTGTIFGQSVTANVPVELDPTGGALTLGIVTGLAFDSAGDLFISRNNYDDIIVIPKSTSTIFGQSVTADTPVELQPSLGPTNLTEPEGLAFDSAGDLFVADDVDNDITVVPHSTGMIFGQSVTADTPIILDPSGGALSLDGPEGLTFDGGNLFVVNYIGNDITVVPHSTGMIFGQSVTGNTPATFTPSGGTLTLTDPEQVAMNDGNLYILQYVDSNSGIVVVPGSSGTYFGQGMTLWDPITFAPSGGNLPTFDVRFGIAFDSAGDLFTGAWQFSSMAVVPVNSDTIFGQAVTADTPVTLTAFNISLPEQLAVDAQGDLFVANYDSDTVTVLPAVSGMLFGQSVSAGVAVTLDPTGGPLTLNDPWGLAVDSAGDLFIGNWGSGITVVPAASGTIFGQSVTADTPVHLSAGDSIHQTWLAFDSAGDLFVANLATNLVEVLPASTGTIFGQSVTANTEVVLAAADTVRPEALAVDPEGNLYISDVTSHNILVLPAVTGTIFGQSVTANTEVALTNADDDQPWGLTFDSYGDLYAADLNGGVAVLPGYVGTLYGQSVTPNTSVDLDATSNFTDAQGIVMDSQGNLYVANADSVIEVSLPGSPPAPTPPSPPQNLGTTTTTTTTTTTVPTTTTTTPARPFTVTGVSGIIVAGERSTLSITGFGFYAQPTVTIGVPGLKFVVAKDTGTALTVYVTSAHGLKFKAGTYTVTVRLANAKQASKRHYFS